MSVATALGTANGTLPIVELDYENGQTVAIGALANASTAIASEVVRLTATVACYFSAGAAPEATSAMAYLPANVVENVAIKSGWKVSVIRASEDGTLSIIPARLR